MFVYVLLEFMTRGWYLVGMCWNIDHLAWPNKSLSDPKIKLSYQTKRVWFNQVRRHWTASSKEWDDRWHLVATKRDLDQVTRHSNQHLWNRKAHARTQHACLSCAWPHNGAGLRYHWPISHTNKLEFKYIYIISLWKIPGQWRRDSNILEPSSITDQSNFEVTRH